MATLVERYPQPHPLPLEARSDWLLRWVTTVDHKRIGILYLLTTLAFFALGGLEALLIRLQLAVPRSTFLSPDEAQQRRG